MIIFDFDQTLIDTSPVEHLRRPGGWTKVTSSMSTLLVYEGVHALLHELHGLGQTLAIVTTSPNMVPDEAIKLYGWPIDFVIGYHQVTRRKPDPEGLMLAMQKGGATSSDTIHVGDKPDDTRASRAAGVIAIGAAWGAADVEALKTSKPDFVANTVADLRSYLLRKL